MAIPKASAFTMGILLTAIAFLSTNALADEIPDIKTPEGWRSEKITMPPGFAPTMKLQGIEDIRFAPGMFDGKSDEFFSYVIMFWVPEKQVVTKQLLENELLTYYQGLSKAVMRDQPADTSKFSVTLKPVKQKADAAKPAFLGHDRQDFTGDLDWVEPFVTKKSQKLHFDVQSWHCQKSKHRVVFIAASPQPATSKVWKSMRDIRAGFQCHAE